MSDNIINIYRNAYKNGFILESQQTMSKLQPFVVNEKVEGEKWFVDRMLANTTSSGITEGPARHADTAFVEYDFQRRMITPVEYVYSVLVDKIDKLKTIQDPKSDLVQEGVRRFNRQKDALLIAAATGTAYTGVAGATGTILPSTQVVASGTTGLTKTKINATDELFNDNDVPMDDEKFLVIGPQQLSDLRGIEEFTSADYAFGTPLGTGMLPNVLGYTIIVSTLLNKTGSIRTCFAFSRGALALGMGIDVTTRLEEYQSKNYNWNVFARMALGATRLAEEKVVKIECVES